MAQDHPSAYITWPNAFQPLPNNLPPTVPPPLDEGTLRAPFSIDPELYNFALRPEIPFTFAAAYVVTVFALNAYNRNRDHQPWSISKTRAFHYFVVVHNVVLALYSFATFAAMARAIFETWPGFNNQNGAAGMADALCKLHGPRGLGDAATFNTTINIWEVKNTAIHLLPSGNPDPTDVGRLWNEGLAFWGWLFYVSKFYEVIDTLIILAKGKRSATLQTYHHAGAMLCMWAGIRYMSPPIWMFVFINSFIHALMYTYFTLSALGVRVPVALKRTLTSLQIAQFVFGASYAAAHLFVAYDIPVQTPYQVASAVERAVSTASSAASGVTSTVSEVIHTPTITASVGSLIKKFLLRAAGDEGVAERVAMSKPDASAYAPGAASAAAELEHKMDKIWEQRFETHYRTEWTRVNCIDTTGEAFAIYLNLLYLAPLTYLFGRFFVRAYTARGKGAKPRTPSQAAQIARDMVKDARKNTEQSFEKGGMRAEDELAHRGSQGKEKGDELYEQVRQDVQSMKDGKWADSKASERMQNAAEKAKGMAARAEETAKTATGKAKEGAKSMAERAQGLAQDAAEQKSIADESAGRAKETAKDAAQSAQSSAQSSAEQKGKGSENAGKDEPAGLFTSQEKEDIASRHESSDAPATKNSHGGAADDATVEPAAGSEPAEKQEENLAASEPTRPAPETESAGHQVSSTSNTDPQHPLGQSEADDKTYSEALTEDAPTTPQADEKNTEKKSPEDDTDAMGRSGVGIDSGDASPSPSPGPGGSSKKAKKKAKKAEK